VASASQLALLRVRPPILSAESTMVTLGLGLTFILSAQWRKRSAVMRPDRPAPTISTSEVKVAGSGWPGGSGEISPALRANQFLSLPASAGNLGDLGSGGG
jgi:hypothetical protein